jgi:hypothetical protein
MHYADILELSDDLMCIGPNEKNAVPMLMKCKEKRPGLNVK